MWKTIEIVPSSIRNDPQVQAACEAIDVELLQIYDCMSSVPGGILFWPFVDQQVPPLLDILAWEMHIDTWQNIEGDPLTIEKKRELINESIDWHRHKGTRYAVDRMLEIVFGQGRVTEWYEYDGEPYYFRILFEGAISGTQWNTILEAVYAVKNVRSWLDTFLQTRLYRQQLYEGIVVSQHISTRIKMEILFDAAVSDFFVRAGITNATQKVAVNNLVLALKDKGIWNSIRALYPFVGGTAASHSHNLKSSDYQIAWAGGTVVHDSNGATGAGGYGNTTLNISSGRNER